MPSQTASNISTDRTVWSTKSDHTATTGPLSEFRVIPATLHFRSEQAEQKNWLFVPRAWDKTLHKEDWIERTAEGFRSALQTGLSEFVKDSDEVDRRVKHFSTWLSGYWDRNVAQGTAISQPPETKVPHGFVDKSWAMKPPPPTVYHVDMDTTPDSDEDVVVYRGRNQSSSASASPVIDKGSGFHDMPLKIYDDLTDPSSRYFPQNVRVPRSLDECPADEWVSKVSTEVIDLFKQDFESTLCNKRMAGNSLQDHINNLTSQVIQHRLAEIGVKTYYRKDDLGHSDRSMRRDTDYYTLTKVICDGTPAEDQWMGGFLTEIVDAVQHHFSKLSAKRRQAIQDKAVGDALSMYYRIYPQSLRQSQPSSSFTRGSIV
ncbi:hypothetical protein IAT40_002589 [Kwoniella sp. CBS 6097]